MKNTQIAEFNANVQSQVLITLNHNSTKYPARSIEKVAGKYGRITCAPFQGTHILLPQQLQNKMLWLK